VSWGEHHSESERLAAAADVARRSGDPTRAEALYRRAAQSEAAALAELSPDKQRTVGITAVSAVALWYKAHEYEKAESLAYRSLASGGLPGFAIRQLQELLQMLWAASAADRAGRRFVPGDVLVSVKGGIVVHGGAPLDLIQQKVEGVQAILFRVVEMLLGMSLRRRGVPPSEVQSLFRPWLFQAPAGSYQFAVRIEASAQLDLFEQRPNVDEITSTFFSVLRATAMDPDVELASLVQDRGYREAFLNLSRNLAPTGKTFDRLEIRDASTPALEPVTLEQTSRRDLNAALRNLRPRATQPAEEVVQVLGTLRGLHLDRDWLEIVPPGGSAEKPTRIEGAGDVLDDVVGPMVNHRVVVTAIRRRSKLIFQDIEPEE
jgi:hypothetical protein